jgi:hypothetical protein
MNYWSLCIKGAGDHKNPLEIYKLLLKYNQDYIIHSIKILRNIMVR